MKLWHILILTCTFICLLTNKTQAQPGRTDTLYSKILGENRRILIHLPTHYGDDYFTPPRYPVLYLLDGDSHFSTVSSMVQQLSEGRGPIDFPELIIVAIPNTDRLRDLTPTHITYDPTHQMDSIGLKRTGGGEKFLSFIASELIPHIDSLYRTTPYRIFMGHSLGGLMAIHAFVHHTTLFNAFVAMDPSMSWDDQKLLNQANDIIKENKFAGRSLYLAIADNLRPGLDTTGLGSDTASLFSRHMNAIFALRNTILTAYPHSAPPAFIPFTGIPPVTEKDPPTGQPPFRFAWKYYPDYDHGALPLPAEYDALRFIFSYYTLVFPFPEFFQPAWKEDNLLAAHYKTISWYMGYRVPPPEFLLNNTGYQLMGSGHLERAAFYFHLNMESYPKSFNVYDSMGDLLAAWQQKDSAIKCYQKALTLKENADTRQKMEKLRR